MRTPGQDTFAITTSSVGLHQEIAYDFSIAGGTGLVGFQQCLHTL